ncbi:DUF3048 domain-containing protein [Robertmurraya andreesenii]|uniref:Lipoprotein yerB n=1 Tax=Anoxybacillus andreesenii TaxID=1325932 RepID=A0ABT9V7S4_9BACL|nr:DUF3048 domain-containing protein [Robertmurraya andreesenii]MDQ0156885.1 hypothetical protein [Robertmurraya andreesenii]
MKRRWIVLMAVFIAVLAGCSDKKETVKEHEEKEVTDVTKKEKEVFPYQAPLTGVGLKEEPSGRAYAVMINNDPKARPQSGFHKADIVYELLAEGNVTRFLAIFQSEQADRIGPVRSARDYFIELAKGYDALYIAHGYSPEAKKMLDNGYVDHINGMQYDGSLFKRDKSRVAPHNSYITSENVLKGAEKIGYDMDQPPSALTFLTEKEIEQLDGEKATSALISYFSSNLFNVQYEYDEHEKKYKRYSNGELTVDSDSKDPLLLDNILILEAEHKVIDSEGRREINLASGGDAYLLQRGQWKEVEWKNQGGKLLPFANGREVGFVPGKTWINIVPSGKGLEQIVSFEAQ